MGRLGIGYKDVERAINEILAKDLNPTVDRIRELLGTGSKTTIVNHLKSWRTNKDVGGDQFQNSCLSLGAEISFLKQQLRLVELNRRTLLQEKLSLRTALKKLKDELSLV